MALEMQNPGGQAGASRNQLGRWLHTPIISSDGKAQMPSCLFDPIDIGCLALRLGGLL